MTYKVSSGTLSLYTLLITLLSNGSLDHLLKPKSNTVVTCDSQSFTRGQLLTGYWPYIPTSFLNPLPFVARN